MATDLTLPAAAVTRRRPRTALLVALAVGAVAAALIVVLATRPPATTRVADSPLVGRHAPDVTAPTLDGEPLRLADLQGRWVLVNFFATWCVPCRQEHPHLIQFHQRHDRVGDATVVGVIYDDSTDAVRRFRAAEGGDWPMLVDPNGKVALEFGVAGVPESFLIDPGGVIVAKVVGGVRADELEDLLARAQTRGP